MLLGSLGGSVNQSLVIINSEEIGKLAVAWDTEKHLRFDVPFVDLKPSIYLGNVTAMFINVYAMVIRL